MATYRVMDIEQGMPTSQQALRMLESGLALAKRHNMRAVKVIHGYGSTGKGGKIRTAARKALREMHAQGQVEAVVYGEAFSIFDETTRRALARCPEMRTDPDLDRHNNGVTIVVL